MSTDTAAPPAPAEPKRPSYGVKYGNFIIPIPQDAEEATEQARGAYKALRQAQTLLRGIVASPVFELLSHPRGASGYADALASVSSACDRVAGGCLDRNFEHEEAKAITATLSPQPSDSAPPASGREG